MFSALIHRAQATVDKTIDQVVNRAIIAVPFIVAGAFATAALAFRLNSEFGPEMANLILAGLFATLGVISAFVFRVRKSPAAASAEDLPAALSTDDAEQQADQSFSQPDRELLMAALTSAAPIALPSLLRLVMRNLPLVVAILSAIFVMTRPSTEDAASQPAQP